jgi:hypothetical protein
LDLNAENGLPVKLDLPDEAEEFFQHQPPKQPQKDETSKENPQEEEFDLSQFKKHKGKFLPKQPGRITGWTQDGLAGGFKFEGTFARKSVVTSQFRRRS